jgi:hypothetical protein
MAIPRGYVPNHKFWDRMGRITPNVEWSESHRPHFESFPAPWLPVQRYEKEIETYYTVSAGKVVGEDRVGNLVPAGLRKAFNKATTTTVLSYVAADAEEGVLDLTTGETVAAAVDYTEDEVTEALRERGLIRADERAMDFISKPVGIASYNYYKAPGSDWYNPRNLVQHNFRPQGLTAITCDYAITLPVLPMVETTEPMDGAFANLADSIDWTGALGTRTGGWFGSTAINGLVKYSSSVAAGADIVMYVFEKFPLAHITTDHPLTPDTTSAAGLVRHVSAVTKISAAGDYFVDYDLGLLFLYEAGGDAVPSPWTVGVSTVTYYHYEDIGTNISTYTCATGNLDFGDFLTYDENSNFVKAALDLANPEGYDAAGAIFTADTDPDYSGTDATISHQLEQAIDNHLFGIVGQIIGLEKHPKGLLDRVYTAYKGQTAANMRTPGSATGGRTDQLTYSNSAERMIIVNLVLR